MNDQEKAIIDQCQKWYDHAESHENDYLKQRAHLWAADYMHGLSMSCVIFDCASVLAEVQTIQHKCRDRAAEIRSADHE